MQPKLKNRPYKMPHKRGEYGIAVQEWFEGFEKRQRFLLTKNEHGASQVAVLLYKHDKLGLDPVQAIEWFIKQEVLGVDE